MISRYNAETLKRGPNEEEEAVHQVILKLINIFLEISLCVLIGL